MQPQSATGTDTSAAAFNRPVIEAWAQHILDHEMDLDDRMGERAVVVRCGEHGCLVVSRPHNPRRFLPYHDSTSVSVLDPTGAGNAFLGGFAIGLAETDDLAEAAIRGAVSASFAVEQISLPVLLDAAHEPEMWNRTEVASRLERYRKSVDDFSNTR